ncbi:phosphonopyruvate decarboxylase [Salinarimonas chemoclinalis]|uniref:phosphonopyruvate decarboxylase n=1 Tax=Salinarimonas chemoclinalis TaxID=3241599 RepID=UPI00355633C5
MDELLATTPRVLAPGHVRDALVRAGIDAMSGVPCSLLTPLIDLAIADPDLRYLPATSEGEAVGIAAGAWLAGRRPAVILQNSGLGNTVNPITSLNDPFRIPLLLLVTWRGEPGKKDEPQHRLMGAITPDLLELMHVPQRRLEPVAATLDATVAEAVAEAERRGSPSALVIRKGVVDGAGTATASPTKPGLGRTVDRRRHAGPQARIAALHTLLDALPDDAGVVATTGKTGRELFTLRDREQHLYLVGAMGLASAVGLGAAHFGRRRIVVVDGDGAALMKLGNMATIGAMRPERLVHVLLDNGVHDSTGGQATVSGAVDFPRIATGCGYATAQSCDDPQGLADAMGDAIASPGPHFLHMRIAPGSIADLARPTIAPADVARRFRRFLTS